MQTRLLALFAPLFIIAPIASGTVIHVDVNGGGDHLTIQDGLNAADDGDTVLVAPGVHAPFDFPLLNATLRSTGGNATTIVDGGGTERCIELDYTYITEATRIEGFTFRNGLTPMMWCYGASPIIVDCAFLDGNMNGAYCLYADPFFLRCVFSGNPGTGIICGTATFQSCEFVGNGTGAAASTGVFESCEFTGNAGRGVVVTGGEVSTFLQCTFSDNDGGAARVGGWSTDGIFDECFFSGNTAADGACVSVYGQASVNLTYCTATGNEATASGGVVRATNGSAIVWNCTLVGNRAPVGAIASVYVGPVTTSNSILAFSPEGELIDVEGTSTTMTTHCIVYGNAAGDSLAGQEVANLIEDPLFCDLGNGDFKVCTNSLCRSANNPWGKNVGAHPVGCDECAAPVESKTWGAIKALYLRD